MKILSALLLGSLLLPLPASFGATPLPNALRHLDLEMTGAEYRALESKGKIRLLRFEEGADDGLEPALNLGKRNLDWLIHLNSKLPEGQKVSISDESTQVGYPVEAPKTYNPRMILASYARVTAALPEAMAAVLLRGAEFTDVLPVAREEYIRQALEVDRVYQIAARWRMMQPWLEFLEMRSREDVRAYLTLKTDPALEAKLRAFGALDQATQGLLKKQVEQVCLNDEAMSESECTEELGYALENDRLWDFYEARATKAEEFYRSFFDIPRKRRDVTWTSDQPDTMTVPILKSGDATVEAFLRDNIEGEYQWKGWGLKLDFRDSGDDDMTHVVFRPGVTPNVNGIAGSVITMDANAPLTEYDVRWTIRHEYGHVLGFPDCYIEFWDKEAEAIVSYQLDITDLMCSRRGKFKERHYDALAEAYLTN